MRIRVSVWGQRLFTVLGLGSLARQEPSKRDGAAGPLGDDGTIPLGSVASTSGVGAGGGRPFLVDRRARVAEIASRSDWPHDVALLAPSAGARRELFAQAWTELALMEHASIAAFARFTLQLLSLGAPPDLVERSNAAQVDETRHARVCFAIASAYGAKSVGPGALRIDGALEETSSLLDVLVNVIEEGCIGETIAALEAAEAREHAIEPAVRRELLSISRDELRHAELAWSFVEWALRTGGEQACTAAARAFSALARQSSVPPAARADDATLLAGGILPANVKAALRNEAIETVILPCARRVLERVCAREGREASAIQQREI